MTEYMGRDNIVNLHIQGKPYDMLGYNVTVSNTATGQGIGNIKSIIALMEARGFNKAIVTYYKVNEKGNTEAGPIEITEELDGPNIDITALPVPAHMLLKVVDLWELAQDIARLGVDSRHCPFCNPEVDRFDPTSLLHQANCPVNRAIAITKEG